MEIMYILQNGNTDQYKIGITNNLNRRIKQLQTGCPGELRAVALFYHNNRKQIEKYERILHNYYNKLNVRIREKGEWYNIPTADVEEFAKVKTVKEQEKIIKNILKSIDN